MRLCLCDLGCHRRNLWDAIDRGDCPQRDPGAQMFDPDFTDDPLLLGRNLSCLDTQLKRLGGPNFTKLPVNAPKGCPVSNYQQDGRMQTSNRKGRVNYEPNGWGEGPRAHPLEGDVSFAAPVGGVKARLRRESLADH